MFVFDIYLAVSLLSTYLERARQDLAACVEWDGCGGGGGVRSSNNDRLFQVRVTIIYSR